MALEHAKKFLEKAMKEPELNERIRMMETGEVVTSARNMGFDFIPEELDAALQEFRQAANQIPEALDTDEMSRASGASLWNGEDAPDGHEMGCMMTYHGREWSIEHDVWCKLMYSCYFMNIGAPAR